MTLLPEKQGSCALLLPGDGCRGGEIIRHMNRPHRAREVTHSGLRIKRLVRNGAGSSLAGKSGFPHENSSGGVRDWTFVAFRCKTLRVNDEREHGAQPLDALMTAWGLGNHELVDASTEQLTHKQVQRARTGRTLTLHMMQKATRALNIAIWYRLTKEERESYFEYLHKHLFSYAKNHEAAWTDPNVPLMEAVRKRGGKIIDRGE